MLRNYNIDSIDNPSIEAGRLRKISKYLRFEASGIIPGIKDSQKIKQYKELLFSAAKQVDEASKLIPEEPHIIYEVRPWWIWLMLGMFTTTICFLAWVAYMRFVTGARIGFINGTGL